MLVLHANWSEGALRLWGESLEAYLAEPGGADSPALPARDADAATALLTTTGTAVHTFAASPESLRAALDRHLGPAALNNGAEPAPDTVPLRLPAIDGQPCPSDFLAAVIGTVEQAPRPDLRTFTVPCLRVEPASTLPLLLRLECTGPDARLEFSHGLRFWIEVGRAVLDLLAEQRFIPTVVHTAGRGLEARWEPWLHDESARRRIGQLLTIMPPSVRAVADEHDHHPWSVIREAMQVLTDLAVRQVLREQEFLDALEGRDPSADSQVAWLGGLLGGATRVDLPSERATELLRAVGAWVARLDETGADQPLHLCLHLHEPIGSDLLPDLEPLDDRLTWRLSLHLRRDGDPPQMLDADQIWAGRASSAASKGARDDPEQVLLAELHRAGPIYPPLESALQEAAPTGLDLTTSQAIEFLSDAAPILEESGITVERPPWWDRPEGRLGLRLHVEAAAGRGGGGDGASSAGPEPLGLGSLVRFRWQVAVGDQAVDAEAFQRLLTQTQPLVRVLGRWVRWDTREIAALREWLRDEPGGTATLGEALQMAHGLSRAGAVLPVTGIDASGWLADLLEGAAPGGAMPQVEQPPGFEGQLRPYQQVGLSWLAFLDRLGLGGCLADDMGLGKTIQLIALLLHERLAGPADIPATLVVVPTSLVENWQRELHRFAPELRVHVQHGPDRPAGELFAETAEASDVVITTYGLVARDLPSLQHIQWHRVVLDEAQLIKNPPAKQTRAIRALSAARRLALTGTPVENRLSELWSIMEFCNPGFLGPAAEFRRRFAVPIERHRDPDRTNLLRRLVGPFVLRRVKTDPKVISDLPPCVETREYAHLTPEQAARYESIVDTMLGNAERLAGMECRGAVLAGLVKLKQVCDHPALLGEAATSAPGRDGTLPALVARSGKARRLISMLEEVLASGQRALIFSQFRQMGHLLSAMVQHELDRQVLFLHGGTPQVRRQRIIDRFQDPDGDVPVLVLSLRAGGLGLNLTAASHVFHYDRWWNPAVESQATDRAHRIGQTRTVHVHKFVCVGTLEEHIDQMLERKKELARNVIGTGEAWLTELSTRQLREVLSLRRTAMEMDP